MKLPLRREMNILIDIYPVTCYNGGTYLGASDGTSDTISADDPCYENGRGTFPEKNLCG